VGFVQKGRNSDFKSNWKTAKGGKFSWRKFAKGERHAKTKGGCFGVENEKKKTTVRITGGKENSRGASGGGHLQSERIYFTPKKKS